MKSQFTKERAKKFLSYYTPHRKIFLLDMLFVALSAVSSLLFPLASGILVGRVLTEWDAGAWARLVPWALVLVLLTAVKGASNVTYAYFGHAMGARMEESMREELFRHYESLSFDFHARNTTGKLMTVLSNDLTNMTELFHHGPEELLMTAVKFFGAFAIMFRIHMPLTLLVFLALPVLGLAAYRADRQMERCLLENKGHLSELNAYAEDTLSGIRTVKAFGKEAEHTEGFRRKNRQYTRSKCVFYKVEACFYETVGIYPQLLSMMVVIFGSLFIAKGSLDAAILVTFLLYAGSLAEPIGTFLNCMRLFEEGKASFIRFMEQMEIQPSVTQKADAVCLTAPRGEVSFRDVSFRYPGSRENVVENISFSIQPGCSAALVGVSGIGKTTLASLLARFYDVCDGAVWIDGVDVRDLSLRSLRQTVGIVQQDVYIFDGTIRENIRYGREDATEEEIIQAAKLSNIHEFILSLKDGYDSLVGTRGVMLSGGQRQRISMARLFLKDPKILILDEATSALDYESEQVVRQSLERLKQNRTSLIIAHRLSTVRDADRIYVLADKHIVEQGTHEQLIRLNGEYARLCRIGAG